MTGHRKKQDCQARRLNFDGMSDEEDQQQQAVDNAAESEALNDASLLEALPLEPLEGFTLNLQELAAPHPSPASSTEEPTILYGEGLLQ